MLSIFNYRRILNLAHNIKGIVGLKQLSCTRQNTSLFLTFSTIFLQMAPKKIIRFLLKCSSHQCGEHENGSVPSDSFILLMLSKLLPVWRVFLFFLTGDFPLPGRIDQAAEKNNRKVCRSGQTAIRLSDMIWVKICHTVRAERRQGHKVVVVWQLRKEGQAEDKKGLLNKHTGK